MARSAVVSVPFGSYPAGTYQLASTNVGKTASVLSCVVDVSGLGALVGLVGLLTMEGSSDNGTTWTGLGGTYIAGGVTRDRQGNINTETSFSYTFANPAANSYRVRGVAQLFQPAAIALSITAE